MKEHNIDQLFRQKLQQHTVSPAPAAWDKVHAGLNTRRRKRGGYYAAAAAVVLLLSAGWLGLQQYQQQEEVSPSQRTLAVQDRAIPSPVAPALEVPEPIQPVAEQAVAAQAAEPVNSTATELRQVPQQPEGLAQQDKAAPKSSQKKGVPAVPAAESAQALQLAESLPAEEALAKQQPLPDLKSQQGILELPAGPMDLPSAEWALASAEPVIIRYDLKDQQGEEEEDERESAPEKVLALFQKVKHGEIGLADVRQAKDNLLSGRINKP